MSNGYISWEPERGNGLEMLPEDFERVLRLARIYGWDDADAAYELHCAGDSVEDDEGHLSAEQASRFAEIIEEALGDIPGHDARRHKLRPAPWAGADADQEGWLEEDPRQPLSPLEWFSDDARDLLVELAGVCRRGQVRVLRLSW